MFNLYTSFINPRMNVNVDLLASGASLVLTRSGRPRATKSREVDLSLLMGFHLHFGPKMGSGLTRIWGFKVDELRGPEKNKTLFQSRVNTGNGDFTTKESLTSAHILKLQRLSNTRIPLPVTLTGSEKVS